MSDEMVDAEFPENILLHEYPEDIIIAGYIGGAAAHKWTFDEWRRFHNYRKHPIFVNPLSVSAHDQAMICLSELHKLGVPKHTSVSVDPEWLLKNGVSISEISSILLEMLDVFNWANFRLYKYGSLDWVFELPPCDGTWLADYNNNALDYFNKPGVRMIQYLSLDTTDKSKVHRWVGDRRISEDWLNV